MERDGAETKRAEEDGDALGFVHGAGEDDGSMAEVLVDEMHEVDVFVLVGDEDVLLDEGEDGLVRVGGDADAEGVVERGSLEGFHFGGHGGAEEVCVSPFSRQDFEDLVKDGSDCGG